VLEATSAWRLRPAEFALVPADAKRTRRLAARLESWPISSGIFMVAPYLALSRTDAQPHQAPHPHRFLKVASDQIKLSVSCRKLMPDVMQKLFKDKVATPAWQDKIRQIVPSFGTHLNDDPKRVMEEWSYTSNILQLTPPSNIGDQPPTVKPDIDAIKQDKSDVDPDLNPEPLEL
jgi:hypothetical protein